MYHSGNHVHHSTAQSSNPVPNPNPRRPGPPHRARARILRVEQENTYAAVVKLDGREGVIANHSSVNRNTHTHLRIAVWPSSGPSGTACNGSADRKCGKRRGWKTDSRAETTSSRTSGAARQSRAFLVATTDAGYGPSEAAERGAVVKERVRFFPTPSFLASAGVVWTVDGDWNSVCVYLLPSMPHTSYTHPCFLFCACGVRYVQARADFDRM